MNKNDLLIDKYQLDKELIEQAAKYYEVSEECAVASSKRDEAYDNIKTVDAKLYFDLRKELEESGTKATESMVSNLVLNHPDHKKAVETHLELKLEADVLISLKEAFSQRSFMIRELVSLFVSGYYTDNSITTTSSNTSEVRLALKREAMNEVRNKEAKNVNGSIKTLEKEGK